MRVVLVSALAAIAAMPLAGQVQKMDVPGIRNYSRVDATVGCGGQVDQAAMAALRKEGFVSDKTNQPVFIHCGSANRVGGVWMIKRVLQDSWPIDKARVEAEAIGLNNPQLAAFAVEYINTHR